MFDIKFPVIGLSPMDGVTDAAYRFFTNKEGKPDITFTEFVHVIGLCRGGERLWQDFIFHDTERPVVAQLFGAEPEYFYHAAKIVCELGFDGVDINMGCPARTVTEHGAGAALIRTPELAQEIVRQTRKGVQDWFETGEVTGIEDHIRARIPQMKAQRRMLAERNAVPFKHYSQGDERSLLPVSVKTRVGFDSIVVSDWVKYLLEVEPAWLTIHGRTLKQLYAGQADWDAIALGVQTVDGQFPVLANGDVKTYDDVQRVLTHTKAQGTLVGRGTYGNPWWFKHVQQLKEALAAGSPVPEMFTPSWPAAKQTMLDHAKLHVELKGPLSYVQMRKNLAWYVSNIPDANELRRKLVLSNSVEELEEILA
ncbi:MAG: tRNA-dihydrouridine synthase [Candidatus Doudnabacteria bacterium]|nr:tRNA-dihydrouridine synthase [Candidatus Doudnabacteria bacterium]